MSPLAHDTHLTRQVIINLLPGLHPTTTSSAPLCLPLPPNTSISALKSHIHHQTGLSPHLFRLTTESGRLIYDDDVPIFFTPDTITSEADVVEEVEGVGEIDGSFPPVFNMLVRLRGGKGGFGSMLRAQGGKMASQKTTNFEACRDLSGRRLKTVNDAKKLADYLEKEPERQRKKADLVRKKIEEGLKEHVPKKIRFDDLEYIESHEKVLDGVEGALSKALKKDTKGKSKAIAAPSSSSSSSLSLWDEDISDDDEEDEDNESEGDEGETGENEEREEEASSSSSASPSKKE
ncbi:hypothetical protein HK102_005273 [Quaeritorhiza haematococci]|nr:hypothetical protein HK102_005273 [Quaeritorhiza haematococci]